MWENKNIYAYFSSSTANYIFMQWLECPRGTQKYISAVTHLSNVFPVASKLDNASRSVRNVANSIREIHGPVRRHLSEIDGLRSKSRRGQLPWHNVSSPFCCHSCLGSVTLGKRGSQKRTTASRSQRLSPAQTYHNNIILCQPWVKVSPTWRGLIDGCYKTMLSMLHRIL